MLCHECGASISTSLPTCPMCGEPLDEPSPPGPSPLSEEEEAFVAPLFRFPPITAALLVANGLMYILLELYGGSDQEILLLIFGAKARGPILAGEYWRLLTANFLHIGLLHLLVNSFTLFQLGMICENIYGRLRFVVLYVLCGLGGFLASAALSDTLSAGASAALAGLMGATITFGSRHFRQIPKTFRPHFTWYLLPWVLIMIGFGTFYPGIDNWAHLGGLLTGCILGLLLDNQVLERPSRAPVSRPAVVAFVVVSLFCLSSAYHATFSILDALDLLDSPRSGRDVAGEIEVLSRHIDQAPGNGLLHYLRAETRYEAERYAAAEEDYRSAIELGYDQPAVKNALAWLIVLQEDLTPDRKNEAVRLAREAVRIHRDPAFLNTLGWAYYQRGDYLAAIAQLEAALRKVSEKEDGTSFVGGVLARFKAIFSRAPEPGTRCLDLYMLAMAYQQRGDTKRAVARFEAAGEAEAEVGMAKLAPELPRFREEAARLLGRASAEE